MLRYYRRLFKVAFSHSFGLADAISGGIGFLGPPIVRAIGHRGWEDAVSILAWQIPACVFGFLFLARLILAPYWIYQEDKAEAEATAKQLEEAKVAANKVNRKEAIIACLARYLAIAQDLRSQLPTTQEEAVNWNAKVHEWYRDSQIEIQEVGGSSLVARFTATTPRAGFFSGVHSDSQHTMNILNDLMITLKTMIDIQTQA
jgi:hypothetical protein